MQRVYIGESVTLSIDLDTSVLDTDYDLAAADLIFRVAQPGSRVAALEVDGAVVDAAAGTCTVTLADTDTELLTVGEWRYQLIDDALPLVLAEGPLQVSEIIAEPLTEPDTLAPDPPVSFDAYVARGGEIIAEEDWRRYAFEAARVVADVMGSNVASEDEDAEAIIEATCRVAEAVYISGNGALSERFGDYAVTYAHITPEAVAIRALAGTGLTNRSV